MKILLVHNYYGSSAPSGENVVFGAKKALLGNHGYADADYTHHLGDMVIRLK